MLVPRTSDLPPELAAAARAIAEVLGRAGHRAWLVGGAVRDLALGRPVHDADLVSAARPDEVMALFPRTVPVGAAFGIVVVVHDGLEVEVATFREERGYSDGRHPDEVLYSNDAAVDAARRDFTCNALYLDPLDDTVLDPMNGLADLAAGRLATVGDPAERFREDGLRLLRMARFEAAFELAPAPGLHAAARQALGALSGVSPERVLDELTKVFQGPRAGLALRVLDECGVADVVVPGYGAAPPDARTTRLVVLDGHGVDQRAEPGATLRSRRGPDGGTALGLVTLLDDGATTERELRARLDRLRASRATTSAALEIARLARGMDTLAAPDVRLAVRLRAVRSPWFDAALDLALRRARARVSSTAALEALAAWREQAPDPAPEPLLRAADLAALGLAPGPSFGRLLTEAEDLQLDGELTTRDAALRWLAARARSMSSGDD
jgi:tRNA nucleotidyltransferase/poly(A) polymerase